MREHLDRAIAYLEANNVDTFGLEIIFRTDEVYALMDIEHALRYQEDQKYIFLHPREYVSEIGRYPIQYLGNIRGVKLGTEDSGKHVLQPPPPPLPPVATKYQLHRCKACGYRDKTVPIEGYRLP